MARLDVSKSVGIAVLAVALLSVPGALEAQSTGVLQATVRVVDYGASLSALKVAQAAAVTAARPPQNSPERGPFAPALVEVAARPGNHLNGERRSDSVVVTISYLR
jgi:hypothetical protein